MFGREIYLELLTGLLVKWRITAINQKDGGVMYKENTGRGRGLFTCLSICVGAVGLGERVIASAWCT